MLVLSSNLLLLFCSGYGDVVMDRISMSSIITITTKALANVGCSNPYYQYQYVNWYFDPRPLLIRVTTQHRPIGLWGDKHPFSSTTSSRESNADQAISSINQPCEKMTSKLTRILTIFRQSDRRINIRNNDERSDLIFRCVCKQLLKVILIYL